MQTVAIQSQPSSFDALMLHFASSPKKVQRAFTNYIINAHAEEVETRRQQIMVKESLTQALKELKEGKSYPVEDLYI